MTQEQYYKSKLDHHRDRAAYHEEMIEQGINPDYHEEQAARHHDEEAKLTSKMKAVKKKKRESKKDIGPISGGAPLPA